VQKVPLSFGRLALVKLNFTFAPLPARTTFSHLSQ